MHVSRSLILLLFLLQYHQLSAGQPSSTIDGTRKTVITLAYDTLAGPARGFLPAREPKRPRLALVLSGGGARGTAQIGVLKSFERHGIPIDFIAATSMGAIVGGLYASGYSPDEIDSIALHTDWDEVLSLNDETKRTDLFMDQKLARDRTFMAIRFQGFTPVFPSAVASGQRLTDWLSNQTLQALYHPDPGFDNLKIPYRAISTDLISGRRVVMGEGSLSEAIRASATTPLLFDPIERDSMRLIDGGILANVPVDVARERGYDAVVAINTTSGLRTADDIRAPWQTVDQIMSISMQLLNQQQLKNADLVITPPIGHHLTFDLHDLDTLIAQGEHAADQSIEAIQQLLAARAAAMDHDTTRLQGPLFPEVIGGPVSDSLWNEIEFATDSASVSAATIRRVLRMIYSAGSDQDVRAEISKDSSGTHVRYRRYPNPILRGVIFEGCRQVLPDTLLEVFRPLLGHVISRPASVHAMEEVLRTYRAYGYSLARIDSTVFNLETGVLRLMINEGIVDKIEIEGGERTQDAFLLKEFQLRAGEVFRIDRANRGLSNIISTNLFEYVYLELSTVNNQTNLTIRLRERPSQLVRLGLRDDNERKLQGLLDIRDENFQGSGMELGLMLSGGSRNDDATADYKMPRLFGAYLTLNASLFFRTYDTYLFADGVTQKPNTWDRIEAGEYRDVRYGGSIGLSGQFERLGKASVDFILQNVRLVNLSNAASVEERYRLATVQASTVVDTKNAYQFPTAGVGMTLAYEFSIEGLGSQIGYNAMRFMYESFATWGERSTFHPRFTMGFADRTMPLSQQFRLGGRESFYGLREDDSRGRQLILLNFEYRYFFPFRILFDTYWSARYDLGSISELPEELKFSTLRHGIGTELAWRTPIGPAAIGAGKSFFLSKNLPGNPVQQGPLLWYFVIGYQL